MLDVPGLKAKPRPINCVVIIDRGLMGGGIAMCCAEADLKVVFVDVGAVNLEREVETALRCYS